MAVFDLDPDYDETTEFKRGERDDEWYRDLIEEIQTPGVIAYSSSSSADAATENDLKEAAISEAIMRLELRRRGSEINEETAAVMVMPDYVAVCFLANGKRLTARLTAGDVLVLTPEMLFSQGPN